VKPRIYDVLVDGVDSGVVHWDKGSTVCMHRRFSPLELVDIENQVAFIKGDLNVKAIQPAELPQEKADLNDDTNHFD